MQFSFIIFQAIVMRVDECNCYKDITKENIKIIPVLTMFRNNTIEISQQLKECFRLYFKQNNLTIESFLSYYPASSSTIGKIKRIFEEF